MMRVAPKAQEVAHVSGVDVGGLRRASLIDGLLGGAAVVEGLGLETCMTEMSGFTRTGT